MPSSFKVLTSLCIIILLLGVNSSFGVEVRGEVIGEWTVDDSPYIVIGHLTVPDSQELVIEPGVEVLFRAAYRFTVYGRLAAVGTEEDSILFGPQEGVATGWGGLRFLDSDSLTHLKYCILRRGRATGNNQVPDSVKSGANAFIWQGDVLIEDSRIFDGIASYAGGGIAVWNSSPIIRNCVLHENFSYLYAGGISIFRESEPTIIGCELILNRSGQGDNSGWGGGMMVSSNSTPDIVDCIFDDNSARGGEENSGLGGAVHIRNGADPTFIRTKFINNTAFAGGGVYSFGEGTNPIFEWCDFIGNAANERDRVGGGLYIRGSSGLTATYCRFEQNASDRGGAIYLKEPPHAHISHCLFLENGATRGGGAISTSNDLGDEPIRINNCTFIDNRATGLNDLGPHGVWARGWREQNSLIRLSSCIVTGPLPQVGDNDRLTAVYSLIEGGFEGEGNIDEDPCFYGNDTTWYLLQGNSPCIDSGEQELGGDPDETRTDRGWLHFPQDVWDEVADDTIRFETRNTDRDIMTVAFENRTPVPIYATPVDWWEMKEPDIFEDVSNITDDYDIYGVVWTTEGLFLAGGNGEETPKIYQLDMEFNVVNQFVQPGNPDGDGFFDISSDGEFFLYGGDGSRIIEFTADGEFGQEYQGPDGFERYSAIGTDFWNAHGFVDYYVGGAEGTIVRSDDEMWERQRFEIGDPVVSIGIKKNIRELYVITEPDSAVYELSLFSPDDSSLIPLYTIHPPEGHTMGGFDIAHNRDHWGGMAHMIGIWQGNNDGEEPVGDKLFSTELYTNWMAIRPEPKLLLPEESAEWNIVIAGDVVPYDLFQDQENIMLDSYFQFAVNGYGDDNRVIVELDVEENAVNSDPVNIPTTSHLTSTYPNPFNSFMRFSYHLAKASEYKITLTDMAGREVKVIHSGIGRAGNHIGWINGDQLPSGSYMLKLWTPGRVDVRKVVLVK